MSVYGYIYSCNIKVVTIKWKRYVLTLYRKTLTFQGKSTWFRFLFITRIPNVGKVQILSKFRNCSCINTKGCWKLLTRIYIHRILADVMSTWVPPFFTTKTYLIMIRCWLVKRQFIFWMKSNGRFWETFWLFYDNIMKANQLICLPVMPRASMWTSTSGCHILKFSQYFRFDIS